MIARHVRVAIRFGKTYRAVVRVGSFDAIPNLVFFTAIFSVNNICKILSGFTVDPIDKARIVLC